MAPALIALGAQARLISRGGERSVPVEEFFLGPGYSCLQPNELLVEILVAQTPIRTG